MQGIHLKWILAKTAISQQQWQQLLKNCFVHYNVFSCIFAAKYILCIQALKLQNINFKYRICIFYICIIILILWLEWQNKSQNAGKFHQKQKVGMHLC